MSTLFTDLRYAVRTLLRSPGFTAVATFTLALGIGANTAIFSVVNAVLLRPLSYHKPEQLVSLRARLTGSHGTDLMSAPEYQDLRREVPALADVAAIWPISINLTGAGRPERIQAAAVSANYFKLLGVGPVLGRDLVKADDAGRLGYVELISWDLWRRRFGGSPGVIGQTVRIDDDPMTIIGVMPRGFRHPFEGASSPTELWGPIAMDNPDTAYINNRSWRFFEVFGRLQSGATLDDLRAQLATLSARLASRHPDIYPKAEGWEVEAVPLAERVVGDVKPALLVLLGAVGLVLLIACANVANLLLARSTGRDREVAIRTALGGSRLRLVRQLLTESVVLAAVGGLVGLLLAIWGTSALGQWAAVYLPRAHEIGIDRRVLGFTALLILVTGIGFGVIPALQASRPDLHSVLKETGRGASAGRPRARIRGGLVVAEIAISLMLLIGAGLLLRSFQQLIAVDPGFNPEKLLTAQVWLSWPNQPEKGRYFTDSQRRAFYEATTTAMRRIPGVRDVAAVSLLPFQGQEPVTFTIEGRPSSSDEPLPTAEGRLASPNYFKTMGIPILQGQGFSLLADSASNEEVMINRTMAETYWSESPVGGRIQLFSETGPWVTIVGVVGDVRQITPDQPARPELYLSSVRRPGQQMAFIARTEGPPERLATALTEAIHEVDPEQPVYGVLSMEKLLSDAAAERRFSLLLLLLFAGLALVLSSVGIYGVMAYTTIQRRHEIGIRMALGAGSADVLGLVLAQGMRLVAAGVALGLIGSWVLSRVLVSQMYGITARDPLTYGAVALLLAGVALLATYVPAWRATRVDPMLALRSE
jgi:putative ABC transport system permease protein